MGLLINLQRGVLPNIYVLKKLIPWFDAVSNFIENFTLTNPTFKAAAYVTANVFGQQFGFTPPVTRVSAGLYECFFAVPLDATGNFIASVSLANMTTADTVLYDIGVQIVDTTRIRIRIYSLADTAAPTLPIPADHDFYVRVDRLPGF